MYMFANHNDTQSFFKVFEQVLSQVEYHCFADLRHKYIDPLYKELCMIIAEVFLLKRDSILKINGIDISTHLVQQVFSQINNDHVRLVFNNFNNISHHVHNKKAYLRTALYNAVFELESHFVNSPAFD